MQHCCITIKYKNLGLPLPCYRGLGSGHELQAWRRGCIRRSSYLACNLGAWFLQQRPDFLMRHRPPVVVSAQLLPTRGRKRSAAIFLIVCFAWKFFNANFQDVVKSGEKQDVDNLDNVLGAPTAFTQLRLEGSVFKAGRWFSA